MKGTAAIIALAGALTFAAPGAGATTVTISATRANCGAVKTNQMDKPAADGLFGARNITASNTNCGVARRLAAKYVENPYSVGSPSKPTARVLGWKCTWIADPSIAQRVDVACFKQSAQVNFGDLLPSG